MKKLAVVGLTGALALVGLGAVAAAATLAPAPPIRVLIHNGPRHHTKAPYRTRTFGKIVPPKVLCPAGVTNPAYCSRPPRNVCSGKVQITYRLGHNKYLADSGKVILRTTAKVDAKCKYARTSTLPTKALTASRRIQGAHNRFVNVFVSARFTGNKFMTAKTSPTLRTSYKLTNAG